MGNQLKTIKKIGTKELRLGNLVKATGHDIFFKVESIHDASLVALNIHNNKISSACLRHFEAIEFSDEWLEKFGFEKSMVNPVYCDSFYKENIWVEIRHKGGFSVFDENDDFRIDIYKCECVHTFQNLYFYVAGKELDFDYDTIIANKNGTN